jgi:hypothetical protein
MVWIYSCCMTSNIFSLTLVRSKEERHHKNPEATPHNHEKNILSYVIKSWTRSKKLGVANSHFSSVEAKSRLKEGKCKCH